MEDGKLNVRGGSPGFGLKRSGGCSDFERWKKHGYVTSVKNQGLTT